MLNLKGNKEAADLLYIDCLNPLHQHGLCNFAATLIVPQEAHALVGKFACLVKAVASGCVGGSALRRNLERCYEGSLLLSRHSFEVDVFIWELLSTHLSGGRLPAG